MLPKNGTLYLFDPASTGTGHHEAIPKGIIKASDNKLKLKLVTTEGLIPDHLEKSFNIGFKMKERPKIFGASHVRIHEFRESTYVLNHFLELLEPLKKLVTKNDLLWDYYCRNPYQIVGYATWLETIPEEKRPNFLVNLDIYKEFDHEWFEPFKPLLQKLQKHFFVGSASISNSKRLANDLGISTFFIPRPQSTPPRSREKLNKVAFVSANTKDLSYFLLPEIVTQLISESEINFTVIVRDNYNDSETAEITEKLKIISEEHPDRLKIIYGYMDYPARLALIEECKCLIHCYSPKTHFANTPTGTVIEALQQDTIPIGLTGSSTEKEFKHFGIDLPIAAEQTATSIADTVKHTCENYENLMSETMEGRSKFCEFQSHETLFKMLIDLASRNK